MARGDRESGRDTDDVYLVDRYAAPLYIDMKKRVMIQDGDEMDRETGEVKWEDVTEEDETPDEKIFIGRVSHTARMRCAKLKG